MIKRCLVILVLLALLAQFIPGGLFQAIGAEAQEPVSASKISSLLALQVQAKLQAVKAGGVPTALEASPQAGSFDILQSQGIGLEDLSKQQLFIHFTQEPTQSQIAELEAMGITPYPDSWIPPLENHPSGFILADMPIDKLETLAEKGYVVSLETAERMLEPQNDLATQKINADDVWASGYNGTGVRIAVLDSGLDVTHADIPTPVAKKDYSNYPTLDDTIADNVTGHGTHVTGSVLGRGTRSGGVYKGSAPGADLIFLKIGDDTNANASTAAIVNAIKAATDNYSADIITISYGGWDVYHDGTSEEAQAVDYAVSRGVVVFIAAGNDANDKQHYSGTVNASSTTDFIQINVAGAGSGNTTFWFNLVWYDGIGVSNNLTMQFYDPNKNTIPTFNYPQGESSRGTEARMGYFGYPIPAGSSTHYVKVTSNSTSSQFFHLYVWFSSAGSVTFQNADPNYTITSPADADSAIAVGAHVTRTSWISYNGTGPYGYGYTMDTIAPFSSRGPRVDTGASPKPNIVAPGAEIISARDSVVYPWANRGPYYIDNDGPNRSNAAGGSNDGNGPADYYVMHGTSMACPIAAGVAALILQKNPGWTPAQVKLALESTATDKGLSGFDSTYGWGLINALAAVSEPPAVTTNNATDITTNSAKLNGSLDSRGDYSSVNVSFEWGLSSGNYTGTTLAVSMNTTGNFSAVISSLQANTTYYFRAKAVGDNTSYGLDKAFITAQLPPLPGAQWHKTFGGAGDDEGYSVQPTADGGYIIAGSTNSSGAGGYDVYLIKTDASGNMLWQKTFGGANDDVGKSVQPTADGGYIIAGRTTSFGAGNSDVYLIKADTSGNMTWSRTFGGTGDDASLSVQPTADGGYIIAGGTASFGAGSDDVYLIKTDASGNMTWSQTFGGELSDWGYSVQPTADGGYVIAGETHSFGAGLYDVYLIKTNASGNMTWSRTFGGIGSDGGSFVQPTADGGYIIASVTESFGAGSYDVYLIKTDASGSMLWSKTFGGTGDDFGYSMQATADGGYIITGYTNSFGAGKADVYLIKTDASGNMTWSQTFGGAGNDAGLSVLPTADGGYIISGLTSSFGAGSYDVWLIKVAKALVSIDIMPDNPVLLPGRTQQFTANGTYQFGTANITANVTWASSNTSVATINTTGQANPGLATGIAVGTTNITASLDGIPSAPVTLTVIKETTVEINNGNTITLVVSQNITASTTSGIPVAVKGLPNLGAPANGLASFSFDFSWNKNVIRVDSIKKSAETADWNSITIPPSSSYNSTGTVTIAGYTTTFSTANITLLYFGITAVGGVGNSTSINVTITTLYDKDNVTIPALLVNAPVMIVSLVAETSISQTKDSDGVVVVKVNIDRAKDLSTGITAEIPGGIGSYTAMVSGMTSDPAYTAVATPSKIGEVLQSNTDVDFLVATPDGKIMFAYDNTGKKLYKSTDAGVSWNATSIGTGLNGNPIVAMAISPRYATDSTLVAATTTNVYISIDGGANFAVGPVITLGGGAISSIDLGSYYATNVLNVLVGVKSNAGAIPSNVLRFPLSGAYAWKNVPETGTGLTDNVLAVRFSPSHISDAEIVAVTANATLGTHLNTRFGTMAWNVNNPITMITGEVATQAVIAFGNDYIGIGSSQVTLVGLNGSGADDVYRITQTYGVTGTATDLNVGGTGTPTNVKSIAVSGAIASQTLVAAVGSAVVFSTATPMGTVTWTASWKSPTGTAVTSVLWAGGTAYASTTGTDSALSKSADGLNWNQSSLIDVGTTANMSILDSAIVDANTMFIIMKNTGTNVTSLFKTTNGGASWVRVLTGATLSIVKPSPNYATDSTLYVADGTILLRKSTNGGNTFTTVGIPAPVTALAVVDTGTYYTGAAAALYKSGRWAAATGLTGTVKSIAISGTTILVGNDDGDVYISTNDAVSFTRVGIDDEMGNGATVIVVPDPKFATNNTTYAGSSIATMGVMRTTSKATTATWTQLDDDTDSLIVNGLVVSSSGTLYAASGTANKGIRRSLDPTAEMPTFESMAAADPFKLGAGAVLKNLAVVGTRLYAITSGMADGTIPTTAYGYTDRLLTVTGVLAGIKFITVRGVPPFVNPTFDNVTGIFSATVNATSTPPQAANTTVAKVVPILTGNTTSRVSLTVAFSIIGAAGEPGQNIPEEHPNIITFQRGDTDGSGTVDIGDASWIAQYVVGMRTLGQINGLNAASVSHGAGAGDLIDIGDASWIAQKVVGMRDAYFQPK